MSYFILIRGALGSGKTTISKKLAFVLNVERIGIDGVLEEYGLDNLPQDAPCVPIENFIKANEIVLPHVKAQLTRGSIIIFDACFYHKEVIEHLVDNLPFPHYIFTLKAPLQICIERDRLRPRSYGEDAARAVYSLVTSLDCGITIDAVKSVDESVNEILLYLPK